MLTDRVKIFSPLLCVSLLVISSLLPGCEEASQKPVLSPQARWHNNQGVVYMDQHNYTRARTEFEQAIQMAPGYAIAHANLGIAFYSLGKYDSAMVSLQTAIGYDPELLQAHYTLGLIFNAQGKEHEKALQALQKVAQVDPDDPQLLYYLGQVKSKLGQSEEAIDDLQRAIRMDPYNVSAYYALANQYRRMNRREEWREALQTFNKLSQAGHQGVSSSYQGQGMYAEAVIDVSGADPHRDDAHVPIRFAPGERLTDLPTAVEQALATDYDNDGDVDLLLMAPHPLAIRNDAGELALDPSLQIELPRSFTPRQLAVSDYDNDGHADLALSGERLAILLADSSGAWNQTRIVDQPFRRLFAADADHDGDLDLLLSNDSESRLLSNDGQGNFSDVTDQAGLHDAVSALRVVFSDYDNDRDIDFFLLGEDRLQLYSNNRDGTFTDVASSVGLTGLRAVDLAVEDFDNDLFMDLGLLAGDGSLTFYTNREGKSFDRRTNTTIPLQAVRGLRPADLDNDGDVDLAVFGTGGIRLLLNREDAFQLEEGVIRQGDEVTDLILRDFDADGRADIWTDGQLLRNQTQAGNWIEIVAQGLGSNHDGIGCKVEVKTTNRLQKQEVRDNGPLLFGLAAADSVEFVRILWPGGVRQTELATSAGQTLTLTELDRKGTSCPIVYAWDGEQYRFVSDINGGAIIGYLVGPDEYYPPDTDEYIRLGKIAPREGNYVIKMANQLEEVLYIDALQLVAVDHPRGVDIYPNERLLAAPPYPPFDPYPLRDLHPLKRAVDDRGRDILPQLAEIDDDWYDGFALTDIHGYAEEFSITLDLGDLSRNPHPVLLAYGWVDYAHSTSNWAAAQRNLMLHPPRVEALDGEGNWVEISADMGTPAGLPKHMLFDLKDLFPADDYRLRITTNTAVYWDQFLVGSRADVPLQVHRLQPASGDLSWRGYPEHTSIKGTFAFRYHYDRLRLEAPWGTHAGAFTRLGPVGELVDRVDDRFVIMFHGDELTVEFPAASLPPLASGMERSFLFYSDGFGKDMDYHSAHSLTVAPLPFHGMSGYPYPPEETYPQTQAHLDYLLDYNTRQVKGYYQ